jgi:Rap1a immunity proteins
MRRSIVIAGAILSVVLGSIETSHAGEKQSAKWAMTGCHELIDRQGHGGEFRQGICAGQVNALMDLGNDLGLCAPVGMTSGQAYRVVVNYIDNHPAQQNEMFTELAWEALRKAWPCPQF